MARFKLIVRDGPRTSRFEIDDPDELFRRVERYVGEIASGASGRTVRAVIRDFEPIEQVIGRIEVGRRRARGFGREWAGIDVRGDGSTEAWAGKASRRLLEPAPGESAVGTLRRHVVGG